MCTYRGAWVGGYIVYTTVLASYPGLGLPVGVSNTVSACVTHSCGEGLGGRAITVSNYFHSIKGFVE